MAAIRSGMGSTARTSCSVSSSIKSGAVTTRGFPACSSHLTHDRCPYGRRTAPARHGRLAGASGPDDARAPRLGARASGPPPPRPHARTPWPRRHVRRPAHRARAARLARRRPVHAQRGVQHHVRARHHRRRHPRHRAGADHAGWRRHRHSCSMLQPGRSEPAPPSRRGQTGPASTACRSSMCRRSCWRLPSRWPSAAERSTRTWRSAAPSMPLSMLSRPACRSPWPR